MCVFFSVRAIKHRFARNETLFCEGENIRFRRVVGGSLRWKATGSSRQLLFVLQRYNIGTRLSSVSPIFFASGAHFFLAFLCVK